MIFIKDKPKQGLLNPCVKAVIATLFIGTVAAAATALATRSSIFSTAAITCFFPDRIFLAPSCFYLVMIKSSAQTLYWFQEHVAIQLYLL